MRKTITTRYDVAEHLRTPEVFGDIVSSGDDLQAGGVVRQETLSDNLQSMMTSQEVRHALSVHGSIPHHERKISSLRSISSVRPEVSKGERDFLRSHQM
jgi:hypothetical protein